MGGKKRILWLLNHTTLRKFEVPLLVNLGYEVFCPKIFQVGSGDGSASVTYEYDQTLTIPHDVLKKMNQVDYYERVPEQIMEYMNEYFDIVMFHYFPNQFEMLVRGFQGVVFFQAFGLLQQKSYSELIVEDLGLSVLQLTKQLANRFVFAQAYPHLYEVECEFFQQHKIDMPLGLAGAKREKHWSGGDHRFLFVLPRINTADYFRNIYKQYTREFRGMDYVIGGAQPVAVDNDPHVLGYMSNEEYERAMNCSAAMFYHSQEKNHIHYHPFEAIQNGMPLVFMADGMMDLLGGKNLPGRSKTVEEAKKKLKALCVGDKRLAQAICSTQDVLLKHFSYENCREKWEKGMACVDAKMPKLKYSQKKKKIAVILPQPYLGGVLDYTIRLVKCILKGMSESQQKYSIVLGYPDDEVFREKDYFKEIDDVNVTLRTFYWEEKKVEWVREAMQLMDVPDSCAKECCILNDGINYFEDCDYLIFTADRFPAQLFTSKQYTVVAHDYIQRYCPELMKDNYEDSFIQAVRQADRVFTTTQATFEDCVQYAGVKKEKVILTPLMFDLVEYPQDFLKSKPAVGLDRKTKTGVDLSTINYFIWSTNTAIHKNHKRALAGLLEYYHNGGTFVCVVTGVNTNLLDIAWDERDEEFQERLNPYVKELRQMIKNNPLLRKNLVIKGNLPKKEYLSLLQNAKFIFHPGYADNGNGSVIDAACLGVPSICSDYPAMRYIDEYVSLNANFFNPFDVSSIGDALIEGEKKWESYRQKVPMRETLKKYTVEENYRELYDIVRKTVEGLV